MSNIESQNDNLIPPSHNPDDGDKTSLPKGQSIQDEDSLAFNQSHHPLPPSHHKGHHPPLPHHKKSASSRNPNMLRIIPGLHSLISETLLEMADKITNIDEIAQIITEIDNDSLSLFELVKAKGISDLDVFLQALIDEDATRRLAIRKTLIAEITSRNAAVFLPLPPYVIDFLKPLLHSDLVFQTESRLQAHLKSLEFRDLNFNTLADATESLKDIQTLVLDGQKENDILVIRANAAAMIRIMLGKKLNKIILHKIPHQPRGENFVQFDISAYALEIVSI